MLRRSVGSILGVCVLTLAAACSKSNGSEVSPGSGASSGSGNGVAAGPSLGDVGGANGSGSTSGGTNNDGPDCAADVVEAKRLPLDMYIMLDVSGSMLSPTEGDADVSKWQAVSSALADFVSDPTSDGIGVGLQVFPIRHPDAPASCSSNAECGAAFGPCFLKGCWSDPNGLSACEDDADCGTFGAYGPCVTFGVCANNPDYVCRAVGESCGVDEDGQALGTCQVAPPSECLVTADCRAASYSAPAAAIATLPAAAAGLVTALQASTPDPDNLTPTGPALEGAIAQAKEWAKAHPDHQVVAVLATDGQPTLQASGSSCLRIQQSAELQAVAALAAAGRKDAPAISTFVVGVLGTADANSGAPQVLNDVAEAGGTGQAFIIDTTGNVQTKFRAALDAIRAHGLSCELAVPTEQAGKPVDYDLVDVDFASGSGQAEGLFRVNDAASCDDAPSSRGWYYDSVPAEAKPTRITVCPDVCADFQKVDAGSVSIALGCGRRSVVK